MRGHGRFWPYQPEMLPQIGPAIDDAASFARLFRP